TSHDFWLRNLGAPLWKALHLGVYLAYGSVLVHVALGALQSEPNPIHVVLLSLGFVGLAALHLAAARKETRLDAAIAGATNDGFVDVGPVSLFVEGRGRVVRAGSERMAIYRHEGGLFAVSNVCRHQGGPLGEGRIVDGCITCPWHGWNYRPEDGCSPPPFDERIPTYPVRIVDDRVLVKPSR
ncbi:MAG: Rieske (2Fe-2S) protein, partial [Verrucomicrobiales bacterium]|nr:Rieske (2Fe-2S) protein [Verrucomicrobiales bacterium]